jgi:multidrug efflux pump subunit AcrB
VLAALISVYIILGILPESYIVPLTILYTLPMVDFAITGEWRNGLLPHDTIRQACVKRFRPILMTTMGPC